MSVINAPLVSVITPVMNGARFLDEAIRSVRAQSYPNWEYVIVDNCSDDQTGEIARSHAREEPRIRVIRNSERLPMLPNWNHAMRQMSPGSHYCKVLHADDTLFTTCLQQMVAVAEAHPKVSLISAYRIDGERVNLFGAVSYPHEVMEGREVCRRRLLGGPDVFGSPSSVMYRSAQVRGCDPFYNEKNLHADTEACFQLLRTGDFGFVHQVLSYTRRHRGAETARARPLNTHAAGRLYILKTLGQSFLDDSEYKAALRKHLKHYYRFLGRHPGSLLDPKVRAHHNDALGKAGEQFQIARVLAAMFLEGGRRLALKAFA